MDISTPQPIPSDSDPLYYNLLAPNQWPQEDLLPGFRTLYEDYMRQMSDVSVHFMTLTSDLFAIGASRAYQHAICIDDTSSRSRVSTRIGTPTRPLRLLVCDVRPRDRYIGTAIQDLVIHGDATVPPILQTSGRHE